MVDATRALVSKYLGDERHRWRWPEDEQQAADRVEEALDRLAGLDALGGPPPSVEVFRRTLDGELDASLRRIGHLGDGVLVGPASMAIGLELDRLVVLGMAEGAFPPRRLEDSLLHDDERRVAGGELGLRAEKVHDDHRHLLMAMAAASQTTLSFPRGDLRRQGDRSASRWLLADAARLAGRDAVFTEDLGGLERPWLRQVPSYAAGLARLDLPGHRPGAAAGDHAARDPAAGYRCRSHPRRRGGAGERPAQRGVHSFRREPGRPGAARLRRRRVPLRPPGWRRGRRAPTPS